VGWTASEVAMVFLPLRGGIRELSYRGAMSGNQRAARALPGDTRTRFLVTAISSLEFTLASSFC